MFFYMAFTNSQYAINNGFFLIIFSSLVPNTPFQTEPLCLKTTGPLNSGDSLKDLPTLPVQGHPSLSAVAKGLVVVPEILPALPVATEDAPPTHFHSNDDDPSYELDRPNAANDLSSSESHNSNDSNNYNITQSKEYNGAVILSPKNEKVFQVSANFSFLKRTKK